MGLCGHFCVGACSYLLERCQAHRLAYSSIPPRSTLKFVIPIYNQPYNTSPASVTAQLTLDVDQRRPDSAVPFSLEVFPKPPEPVKPLPEMNKKTTRATSPAPEPEPVKVAEAPPPTPVIITGHIKTDDLRMLCDSLGYGAEDDPNVSARRRAMMHPMHPALFGMLGGW